jgi:hypothetical protein
MVLCSREVDVVMMERLTRAQHDDFMYLEVHSLIDSEKTRGCSSPVLSKSCMRDAFRILHRSIEFGKWRSHICLATSCSEDPDSTSERLSCVLMCVYVLTWHNASIWLVVSVSSTSIWRGEAECVLSSSLGGLRQERGLRKLGRGAGPSQEKRNAAVTLAS